MPKMDRKQIRLDKRQHKWLKRVAKARGVPQAEVIREAIAFYIEAQSALNDSGPKKPAANDKGAKRKSKKSPAQPARQPRPAKRQRPPVKEGPAPDQPSKWRSDDPYEERLRQIERLAR